MRKSFKTLLNAQCIDRESHGAKNHKLRRERKRKSQISERKKQERGVENEKTDI